MKKINIAILEDDEDQLHYLKEQISELQNFNVVFGETNTKDFKLKMVDSILDALILDIRYSGEDLSGIEIANKYKLPVLFISSYTNEFNSKIEDLDTQFEFIVERLRKPFNKEMLFKKLNVFYKNVITFESKSINSTKNLFIKTESALEEKIDFDSIVYIKTSEDSRDKDFILSTPPYKTKVKNKKITEILELLPYNFTQINLSEILNLNHIQRLIDKETVEVRVQEKPVLLNISNSYKDSFISKWNKLKI